MLRHLSCAGAGRVSTVSALGRNVPDNDVNGACMVPANQAGELLGDYQEDPHPDGADTPAAEPGAPEAEPFVYVHSVALEPVAAQVLDDAYGASSDWPLVADGLREAAAQRGIDPLSPLGVELVRMVLFDLHLAPAGAAGCQLGPQWDSGSRAYPMRIAEALPDTIQLWRACATLCRAPGAVARANDLLWERREGRPADHARRAVEAYLAMATDRSVDYDTARALVRAWDMACRLSAWDLVATAEEALLGAVDAGVRSDDYMPGVVLPMLAALCAKPTAARVRNGTPSARPAQVDKLLEAAFAMYRADHLQEEIAKLMRARAGTLAERVAVDRRLGESLLEIAEEKSGLAKQAALMKAIDIARARGLPDLTAEGTRRLQGIRANELELQRLSVTVPMPADYFERMVRWGTRGRSWREALTSFLMSGPPTGSLDDLHRRAADHASQGYLHRLFTTIKLTGEGLPLVTAEPNDLASDLAFQAQFEAATRAHVLAEGLRRVADHHGTPDPTELVRYLCDMGAGDRGLAQSLADAFGLFWAGQFDAATHLIVPRVEAALRLILRECDIALYRTQVGKDPGGYPGLYDLLTEIEKVGFDPDWAFFLRWLLLGPHGRNLRNDIAHGLIGGAGDSEAVLALRAASLVILLAGPSALPDWEDEADGRPLSTGVTSIQARSKVHLDWLLGSPAPPHRPRRATRAPRRQVARLLGRLAARTDRLAARLAEDTVESR